MKQVFFSGGGDVEVLDVPVPGWLNNAALVRNAFSLISTGTEGAAVSRRSGLLGTVEKAVQSRDRIEQVWQSARTQGIVRTWELVRQKLGSYSTPGYSSAGQIVETSTRRGEFQIGERVACIGGGFATHSEYAVVPRNLIAKIPEGVSYEEAAFGAVASIAMQGIRRLELSPGDWIGVIGLGLIGQIAAQLLVAMGYRAVGLDLQPDRAARARELADIHAWGSNETDTIEHVFDLTGGNGLDGVLLCAATASDQPVNLAFDLCRKRGRVSLVGDVGLNLSREKMYAKELELRMSCSYGPGRYDDSYEVYGQDYPYAYVRWTEQRNLEYILHMQQQKRLNLEPLISSTWKVEDAPAAYQKLKENPVNTYGVLLDYGPLPAQPAPPPPDAYSTQRIQTSRALNGVIRLGIIGAGSFVKNVHLPHLKEISSDYLLQAIASRTGGSADILARQYGIGQATSDYRTILDDSQIDAVLIATRHSSHARLVIEALEAGKHVFVEKPLCMSVEEGRQIVALEQQSGLVVRVGFNRRFSPYLNSMKAAIGKFGPRMLSCRVNVGSLGDHWSNTPAEGGRLLGEGVHFFDLCNWFFESTPTAVQSLFCGEADITNPNVLVQIEYPDSCVAQVLYSTLGNPGLGKEYFEAFGNGRSIRCDDYAALSGFGVDIPRMKRNKDSKGHKGILEEFAAAVRGKTYPVLGADAHSGLHATGIVQQIYAHLDTQLTGNREPAGTRPEIEPMA